MTDQQTEQQTEHDAAPETDDDGSAYHVEYRPNPWPYVVLAVLIISAAAVIIAAMMTGVITHENTLPPGERAALARD